MPIPEPTWKCPHCNTVYTLAQQDYCSCKGPCATWFKDLPVAKPVVTKIQETPTAPVICQPKIEIKPSTIISEKKALVVNILGNPNHCIPIRNGVFEDLINRGINCKDVTEKEWRKEQFTLGNPIHIFAEYHRRAIQLLQHADVILTDGTLLLTSVYDKRNREGFRQMVKEEYDAMWNYTVFLIPANLDMAPEVKTTNKEIINYLLDNQILFDTAGTNPDGREKITDQIIKLLPE